MTKEAIQKAKDVGLSRWAFSLDGSTAEIHDHFRGTKGSYDRTMKGIEYLKELNIPIQVNTTISKYNLHDLDAIAEKVKEMGTVLWSTFFLVPTGRGMEKDMVSPEEHEEVMKWLYQIQQKMPYGVKTTEAPHYRRVFHQEKQRLGEVKFRSAQIYWGVLRNLLMMGMVFSLSVIRVMSIRVVFYQSFVEMYVNNHWLIFIGIHRL